jgi:hypothetical protein
VWVAPWSELPELVALNAKELGGIICWIIELHECLQKLFFLLLFILND